MALMDFDAEQEERQSGIDREALKFKLGGKVWHRLPEPPAASLTPLSRITGATSNFEDMIAIVDSVAAMVEPEEQEDFKKTMLDPAARISLDTLNSVMDKLLSSSTDLPTDEPSPSTVAHGLTTPGQPSKDDSRSPALTLRPSAFADS